MQAPAASNAATTAIKYGRCVPKMPGPLAPAAGAGPDGVSLVPELPLLTADKLEHPGTEQCRV